jgi:small subunit ribosomal protein S16
MVTIRLARGGAKNRPFFHIVVTDSRKKRDGRHIERIGYFNPVPAGKDKEIDVDLARVDHWIGKGAIPSERVSELIHRCRKAKEAA